MPILREVATVTSKGQITIPKAVRQALEIDVGAKLAFEVHEGGKIVVGHADPEHEDPAIAAFLDLFACDIQTGQHIRAIPDDLAQGMLEAVQHEARLDEEIVGDVDL